MDIESLILSIKLEKVKVFRKYIQIIKSSASTHFTPFSPNGEVHQDQGRRER